MKAFWFAALGIVTGAGVLAAQAQAPAAPPQDARFRVQVQLVTTDAIVRDANGQFVADLTKDDFDVYEDGVKQRHTFAPDLNGSATSAPAPASTSRLRAARASC